MDEDLFLRAREGILKAQPDVAGVIGLRIGLRALPIIMLGQIWNEEQQIALLHILRALQLVSVPFAGGNLRTRGWSDERIERLRQLWDQGRTASEISDLLGGVSRNAVIGKAHSLGLHNRPRAGALELLGPPEFYFDGSAQDMAARAIVASSTAMLTNREYPLTINEIVSDALTDIKRAGREISTLYPAFTPDRTAIPVLSDLDSFRTGVNLLDLGGSRLWPTGFPSPLKAEFPPGNGWSSWRRWYEARRNGRTIAGLPPEQASLVEHEISIIPTELWEMGPRSVNYEIARILKEYLEPSKQPKSVRYNTEDVSQVDPEKLGSVESQTLSAAVFSTADEGDVIDIDTSVIEQRISDDQDACDRHKEVLDSAEDILQLYERFGLGGNQVAPLIQQVERFKEALGSSPKSVRPGLLIPRGERLRQRLLAQERQDEIGAEPPLPPQFLTNLAVLVSSYNVFVALDPVLAKYDEARLPPELADKLIAPAMGNKLIHDAVQRNIATSNVEVVLREEGLVAPSEPDPGARTSRRYTESIRNFARVALEKAFVPLKAIWRSREHFTHLAAGIGKFARWVTAHGDALLSLFPEGTPTYHIIKFVVDTTRKFTN